MVARFEAEGATLHVMDLPEVDAGDEAQVDAFFDALPSCWASVHLIGGFSMAPLARTTPAEFERQWRLNTLSCFLACRAAARVMSGGGRIVNVAARPAIRPTAA